MQHKNRKKIFAWAVSILLLFSLAAGVYAQSSSSSAVNSEIWGLWRKGFEHFENAELKMVSKQYPEAISLYNQALHSFQRVRQLNPRWNREVIEYRITRAQRRVQVARGHLQRMGALPAAPARQGAGSTVPRQAQKVPSPQVTRENAALKRELAETRRTLSSARQQAASGQAALRQVKSLLAERSRLEREAATLRLRYENLEKTRSARTKEYEKLLANERNKSLSLSKMINDQNRIIGTLRKEVQNLAREKTVLDTRRQQLEKVIADDRTLAATQRNQLQQEIAGLRKTQGETAASLETLRASLAKEKLEAVRLQQELSNLRNSGNASNLAVKQTREELARLRKNAEALEKTLALANREKGDLARKSQSLMQEQAKLKKALAANIRQVNDYGSMNDKLVKEVAELKKSAALFSSSNMKLQKEFALLVKERDAFAKRINAGFPEARRLEELRKENARLAGIITAAEKNLKNLQLSHANRVKALESEKTALQNMVAKLEDARKKSLAQSGKPTAAQLEAVEALKQKALADARKKADETLNNANKQAAKILADARKKAQDETRLAAQKRQGEDSAAREKLRLAMEQDSARSKKAASETLKAAKLQAEKEKTAILAGARQEKQEAARLKAEAEKILADARSEKLKAEKLRAEMTKKSLAAAPVPVKGRENAEMAKWKKEQEKALKELTGKLAETEKTLALLTSQKAGAEKSLSLLTAEKAAWNKEKLAKEADLAKLRSAKNALEKSVAGFNAEKSALQKELAEKNRKNQELAGKLALAEKSKTAQDAAKQDPALLAAQKALTGSQEENKRLKQDLAEMDKLRQKIKALQADAVSAANLRAREKQALEDKLALLAKGHREQLAAMEKKNSSLEKRAAQVQKLYNDTIIRHAKEQEKSFKASREYRTKQENEIAILRKKASSLLLSLGDANVAKENVEKQLSRANTENTRLRKSVAQLQKNMKENSALKKAEKEIAEKTKQNTGLLRQMKILRDNLAKSGRQLLLLQERHNQISKVFTSIAAERDKLKTAARENKELRHALAAARSNERKWQAKEKALAGNYAELEKKSKALEAELNKMRNFDDPLIMRLKELTEAGKKSTVVSQTINVKNSVIDALIDELKAERKKQREAFAKITISHNEALRQKRLNDDMTEEMKDLERKLRNARGRYTMLLADVEDGNLKLKDQAHYKDKTAVAEIKGKVTVTVPAKDLAAKEIAKPIPSKLPLTPAEARVDLKEMEKAMLEGEKAEKTGDLSMALWHYWRAADAGEKEPAPYMALTRINILRKDLAAAEKAYRKALELGGKRNEDWEKQINNLR